MGTDQAEHERGHDDIKYRIAGNVGGVNGAHTNLKRRIMSLMLQGMAAFMRRNANIGRRPAFIAFRRENELLVEWVVMVAQEALTLDNLNVGNTS